MLIGSGRLLVGVIPADSPWGAACIRAAEHRHPVYAAARFFASADIVPPFERVGFRLLESARHAAAEAA